MSTFLGRWQPFFFSTRAIRFFLYRHATMSNTIIMLDKCCVFYAPLIPSNYQITERCIGDVEANGSIRIFVWGHGRINTYQFFCRVRLHKSWRGSDDRSSLEKMDIAKLGSFIPGDALTDGPSRAAHLWEWKQYTFVSSWWKACSSRLFERKVHFFAFKKANGSHDKTVLCVCI